MGDIQEDVLKKEYDLFGPWLLLINCQDDVPHLFRTHFTFNDSVRFAFKVPRHIERRDVKPGDILYDSVICLYNDEIIIFERKGNTVLQNAVSFKEIIIIQNVLDLLLGELKIYTPDKIYTITYSTVSEDIICTLVDRLREKYLLDKASVKNPESNCNLENMIPLFRNLLRKIKENEDVVFLDYQQRKKINRKKSNLFYYLYSLFNHYILQSSMYLASKKELIVISRKRHTKRIFDVDYSHIHTYIPFDCIKNIRIADDNNFLSLKKIIFTLCEYKLDFLLDKNTKIEALMKYASK